MPKKVSLLVVDDDQISVDVLVGALQDSYDVSVAMDGPSALEIVRDILPDVVLLDIMMPDMDGYEVCRRIKENRTTKGAMIMFVTGLNDAIDETYGFELGAVDYITKPFSTSVIRARIKTHLDLAEAQKGLQQQNEILKENIQLREQVEQITRHDLKNPLQVIMGTAELIDTYLSPEDKNLKEMVQVQLQSCRKILNMINRSLDLYKMENRSYRMDTKQIDLLPLLDQVFREGRPLIHAMDLQTLVEINGSPRNPGDRFNLVCDEMLFYSMMSNLVKNALEASPRSGQVKIAIHENQGLRIEVENQGVVSPEIRNRFFEKFVTSGKPQGTGLGTYSARMMAELHGASIHLFSSDEENRTKITIQWDKPPC